LVLSAIASTASICGHPTPSLGAVMDSLEGKIIFGFQGWFACPGDGNALGGWVHWFARDQVSPDTTTVDLLPDVTDIPPAERCPTGLTARDGRPVEVFSDQRADTVLRQFQWMRQYGLDGVALQRFSVSLGDGPHRSWSDHVLTNVRKAAEATGRGFFVQYDVASGKPANWADIVRTDWLGLLQQHLASSPAYIRHKGKIVLGITGLGMQRGSATAEEAMHLLNDLRAESAPWGGVTLFGTVPRGWRTLDQDAKTDPSWSAVYRMYDVISPWLVGSYKTKEQIDRYVDQRLRADLAETQRRGVGYMPVIFPGFSWANLKHNPAEENKIPRRCGQFYWEQIRAFRDAGVSMLFGAMFDEVDEGTATFKTVASPADLPASPWFLSLDADGCALPSDWYLRIAGQAARLFRGEPGEFPKLP